MLNNQEFCLYHRLQELGYTLTREQRERRWFHILVTVQNAIVNHWPEIVYTCSDISMAPFWAMEFVDAQLKDAMHAAFPEIMRRDQRTIVAASPISTS